MFVDCCTSAPDGVLALLQQYSRIYFSPMGVPSEEVSGVFFSVQRVPVSLLIFIVKKRTMEGHSTTLPWWMETESMGEMMMKIEIKAVRAFLYNNQRATNVIIYWEELDLACALIDWERCAYSIVHG
jgi:hypothetical protein